MDKQYKPRNYYFTWIVFFGLFGAFLIFGKFGLGQVISILIMCFLLFFNVLSCRNILILNDSELVIKTDYFFFSESKSIDYRNIKKLTLILPVKTRGIKIDFIDGRTKSYLSDLRKDDLIRFGNDLKNITSFEILINRYFKTEKL